MHTPVLGQCAMVPETFRTHLTRIRFLTGVRAAMRYHHRFLSEPFLADVALVRLYIIVYRHMAPQAGVLGKLLAAHGTSERLLPGVHVFVALQRVRVQKLFIAKTTPIPGRMLRLAVIGQCDLCGILGHTYGATKSFKLIQMV